MASISVTGYAIQGGADQDKLSITSSGGVLTLRTAPDFEMPGDVASTAPAEVVPSWKECLSRYTTCPRSLTGRRSFEMAGRV